MKLISQVVEIPAKENQKDRSRFIPIGTRQVINIAVVSVVTENHTEEFLDKKKGQNVHAAFPAGVRDDVNDDESMKAVLFMLNR